MLKFLVLCTLAAMVAADGTRIEYRLSNYRNQGGVLASGKKCDRGVGKKCDPLITATIDTDSPSSAWPGSKPLKSWTKVFEADEQDSAAVNKIVSKDICGRLNSQTPKLRVNVVDVDGDHTTPIEQFECLAGRDVSRSESSAQWSTEKACNARNNPDRVNLMYSWRAFTIPDRECGEQAIGGGWSSSGSGRDPSRRPWGSRRLD
ncbi:hypothetical protein BV898_18538 [Hypsibius exemplaris]|uniref:Secreted protein n=1 Tax=Hypsibius exemplaris TaxID=2072580 RepID=A0A9X6NH37_HYPEX|nr:hypothetical protein BV898_18538 [Hypsibius exemplaris]